MSLEGPLNITDMVSDKRRLLLPENTEWLTFTITHPLQVSQFARQGELRFRKVCFDYEEEKLCP